ncbi:hypothetical protein M0802_007199 [Mischocyttarus mexicanus]|nr:hypothetical protein M0802_007199 [Mischocyttarus mexicanus]
MSRHDAAGAAGAAGAGADGGGGGDGGSGGGDSGGRVSGRYQIGHTVSGEQVLTSTLQQRSIAQIPAFFSLPPEDHF